MSRLPGAPNRDGEFDGTRRSVVDKSSGFDEIMPVPVDTPLSFALEWPHTCELVTVHVALSLRYAPYDELVRSEPTIVIVAALPVDAPEYTLYEPFAFSVQRVSETERPGELCEM